MVVGGKACAGLELVTRLCLGGASSCNSGASVGGGSVFEFFSIHGCAYGPYVKAGHFGLTALFVRVLSGTYELCVG
jgi:hypothetical protein